MYDMLIIDEYDYTIPAATPRDKKDSKDKKNRFNKQPQDKVLDLFIQLQKVCQQGGDVKAQIKEITTTVTELKSHQGKHIDQVQMILQEL